MSRTGILPVSEMRPRPTGKMPDLLPVTGKMPVLLLLRGQDV